MIIVRLTGGLGNQMFQYAAGRRLALRHHAELKLDLSELEHPPAGCTPRVFQLDSLDIRAGIASPEEVAALYCPAATLWERAWSRLGSMAGISRPTLVAERYFHFDPRVLAAPDQSYLMGYWQSEQYFDDIPDTLRREFTCKEPPRGENRRLAEAIGVCNSVSVHVRRGDYVTNPASSETHGLCGMEYYHACVEELCRTVPEPHLFLFSDEPEWVEAHFTTGLPTTIVGHNGPEQAHEDLRLMSLCRHNIIANSSFSWWGAWLNVNPEKLVFAPRLWFRDESYDTRDLIPVCWRQR